MGNMFFALVGLPVNVKIARGHTFGDVFFTNNRSAGYEQRLLYREGRRFTNE